MDTQATRLGTALEFSQTNSGRPLLNPNGPCLLKVQISVAVLQHGIIPGKNRSRGRALRLEPCRCRCCGLRAAFCTCLFVTGLEQRQSQNRSRTQVMAAL